MALLFIENDDSFSWNIIDRLPFARPDVEVVPGRDARAVDRTLSQATAVVLGPGPLDPERAGIVEYVRRIATLGLPLLGICLGHQAIAVAFGAKLVRKAPHHGVRQSIIFTESRFFPRFSGPVDVMRYHSLGIEHAPAPLRTCARAPDGCVMAMEHPTLPIAGLQFHPDSFATPRGEEMLASFFEVAQS